MISYTKRYINIVSLVITIIIFIFLRILFQEINKIDFNPTYIINILKINKVQVELNSNNINQETKEENTENQYQNNNSILNNTEEKTWKIIIPAISLEAPISENTEKETMDKYVGHFEETSKTYGNIGLAAHNRGYEVNYFQNLKKLKEGDLIIYKYGEFEKKYIVQTHKIIEDIDWSFLEETEDNRITLITCVENEPSYRRCIQGIEV
jgi:LPXTG-site transpeptidase (sortase) family protein